VVKLKVRLPNPATNHVEWWRRKVARLGDRAFGPACSAWALRTLDVLLARPSGTVNADNLRTLAQELGVPLKYTPRAIATLTRLGIASARLTPPFSVVLQTDRLSRRKISLQRQRRAVLATQSARLKAQSNHRCACCGKQFLPEELVIDHIIPLSLLGADKPANWAVLSKAHNLRKWDRFLRGALKFYRSERVLQPFGIRFINGFFWPVINGRVRCTRRVR
jgi:hypothetical protein